MRTEREIAALLAKRVAVEAEVQQAYLGIEHFDTRDIFQGLSLQELYFLCERLLDCDTLDEAYTIMAQSTDDRTSNYYDRLMGIQHEIAYRSFSRLLKMTEPRQVEAAMDVGAGTGENTLTIARHADTVIGVDLNRAMLNIAAKKLAKKFSSEKKIHLLQDNVLKLQMEPNSLDFVLDNGLLAYLTPAQIEKYWFLLRTWLKPGGRYYTFDTNQNTAPIFDTTLRAQLARLAIHSLLNHSQLPHYKKFKPPFHLAKEFGFDLNFYRLQTEPFKVGIVQWTKMP